VTAGSDPEVRLFKLADRPLQYKPDTHEADPKSWTQFVSDILEGKRQPFLKSEEPVPHTKGVRVLVGKDHEEITKDPTKNVFVEYYAPWCGHCKELAPKWDQLAESFEGVPNVVIAKMDATKNEAGDVHITGFPTLVLYPAAEPGASVKGPSVRFEGAREVEDLKAFVELNGVGVPQDDTPHARSSSSDAAGHDEL